jgi:hypothetical protein
MLNRDHDDAWDAASRPILVQLVAAIRFSLQISRRLSFKGHKAREFAGKMIL